MKPFQSPACARCAKALGKTCCEPSPHEHLAMVTRADIARIVAHTGLPARRFTQEEGVSEAGAADFEARWPLYRGYFRRGPVRTTLLARAGACVFLDRTRGCTLPMDVRPIACRLYPFDKWADGSWSLTVGRYGDLAVARAEGTACLAVEEAESMEDVLAAFGTTHEAVEALGAQLAEEARSHGRG
ncbi:YkgJ family cysteine cluster protein [Hyalangium versicolor]|uniref:YkgJ family cysteine cluster protein n=1 Tax=Hyalangium versicolor TaxID=2861190 RepID=UPI001CCD20E6|nr:YkgJ family cysteine cluster protein [Hyalangium versicolor]